MHHSTQEEKLLQFPELRRDNESYTSLFGATMSVVVANICARGVAQLVLLNASPAPEAILTAIFGAAALFRKRLPLTLAAYAYAALMGSAIGYWIFQVGALSNVGGVLLLVMTAVPLMSRAGGVVLVVAMAALMVLQGWLEHTGHLPPLALRPPFFRGIMAAVQAICIAAYIALVRRILIDRSKKIESVQAELWKTLEKLEYSNKRFELAMEAINEVVFDWRPITGQIYVSPRMDEWMGPGFVERNADGQLWLSRLHPDDAARSHAAWQELSPVADGPFLMDYRVRRDDGSLFWIQAHCRIVERDGEGRAARVVGAYRDIDEARRAEEALRVSESRNREMIENALDPVFSVTQSGRICAANKSLAELLETSVDQLNTCDLLDLTPSRFHPELVSRFKEASEGVRPKLLEASLRKANGGEAVLELSFRRLPTNSGEPPLIQVFGRDLTLRRSLEEQLRHAQKMESMGRMAGGIAHDFNNLLTVINGFNQLARERLGPGNEVESELGEVRNAGERASRLTGQLLAFSRNQISDPVALEINSSIRELREISGRLLGESIELRLDLDTQSLWVLMDPTSFDQVLLNLVANARDAMPGGGTLCISTGLLFGGDSPAPTGLALPPGKYISIEVTDTGVGMDASTQSKIFDPFFTTKGPGKGTGLGLSTVLGCVERAHGRIWVHSSPNEGTCFQVVIPLTVPPQPSVPEVPVTAPRSAPCSIAVVEDEESVRGFIVSVLENSGHAVRPACSPDEALGWEESYWNQVELLVTDVKMPGSSGAALVESLRRRRPELAVLFVSGFSDGILEQSILDQRTIYLQKPFSVETLLAKVHAAVPRAVPSRSILVVDDDDGIRTYVHSILTGAGHRVACAKDGMEADRLLHSDSFEVLVTDIVMPGVGGLNFLKQAKDRFSIRNVIVASGAFGSESVPAAGNLGADAILAKPFTPRDILGAVERLL